MGTRADFYVGRSTEARWLGSVAFDGWPDAPDIRPIATAETAEAFELAVAKRLAQRDGTQPEQGWPWPWDDSQLTDYAYAFDEGRVWVSRFGSRWLTREEAAGYDGEGPKEAVFPDMSARKNVTFGPRSGVLVFSLSKRRE